MINASISDLKTNPSSIIENAQDYPIAILKRNKTTGYIVSKTMFEKLIKFVEDYIDKKAIENADYKHGTPLNELTKELDLE